MSGKPMIFLYSALLLVFTVFVSAGKDYKDLPLTEIEEQSAETAGLENLEKMDALHFKKDYSYAAADFDEVLYYGLEDLMHSECLLLVKSKNAEKLEALKEKIEKENGEKAELFHDYDAEQYELLSKAKTVIFGDVLVFSVADNTDEIVEKIRKILI